VNRRFVKDQVDYRAQKAAMKNRGMCQGFDDPIRPMSPGLTYHLSSRLSRYYYIQVDRAV